MSINYYNIPLNKSRNKESVDTNISLSIDLSGNKILLPEESVEGYIDGYETYVKERSESNKFRLIFNITPYCTNVLFNPITEIVKNEGSNNVIWLNYGNILNRSELTQDDFDGDVIGKGKNYKWNQRKAIRDTQLSNTANGFKYHCGIDIFNNHILRNKSFKAVNFDETKTGPWKNLGEAYNGIVIPSRYSYIKYFSELNSNDSILPVVPDNFNTIDDLMRDRLGVPIPNAYRKADVSPTIYYDMITVPMHLYQFYDVYSFNSCVTNKLEEDFGWFGFYNASILNSQTLVDRGNKNVSTVDAEFRLSKNYINMCDNNGDDNVITIAASSTEIDTSVASKIPEINRVINNEASNKFIDMYPERELFSFTPLKNRYRDRLEKNWEYCITYPSESIDEHENVDFLVKNGRKTAALKVDRFDENVIGDNGLALLTIYSIAQHGLSVGDSINLYKKIGDGENELLYHSAEVVAVIDKYIFQVNKESFDISNHWVNLQMYEKNDTKIVDLSKFYPSTMTYNDDTTGNKYPVCESLWVSLDETTLDNLFFVKVVSDVECEYYIRKFSRVPNFKLATEEINDYTVNKEGKELIRKYRSAEYTFESHCSKNGFSLSPYNDDVTEIVFTDDIDVSYLKTNRGLPVNEVYLTIVKNNKGYKEWYGIGQDVNINADTVEYSHCFGEGSCQFMVSEYYRMRNADSNDVRDICKQNNKTLGENEPNSEEYFGDLCYYSPIDCREKSIQNVYGRFNTVQREIMEYDSRVKNIFSSFTYDELYQFKDDNSASYATLSARNSVSYSADTYTTPQPAITTGYNEGYYYQMHYLVPIKDVSTSLSYDVGVVYEIYEIINTNKRTGVSNQNQFQIRTVNETSFTLFDKVMMYDKKFNDIYYVTITKILSSYVFWITICDEDGHSSNEIDNVLSSAVEEFDRFVLVEKHEDTPTYAKIVRDGSCRYYWRSVVANGIENSQFTYPFTNGAFYITTPINFFLRRQDPFSYNLGLIGSSADGGDGSFNFTPAGESTIKYPDYSPDYSYESSELDDCGISFLNPLNDPNSNSRSSTIINTSKSLFH